jgi:hypothetical protein
MKRFDEWNEIKKTTEQQEIITYFKQREIYWTKLGQNIGYKTYGKGVEFLRPVLIYKKLGSFSFLGIPLTSKEKRGDFYFAFNPVGKVKINYALLNQARVISVKRLNNKFGKISVDDYGKLKEKFIKLYG